MAISSGVRQHTAAINGILISQGSVSQTAKRRSSTFSCSVPMSESGALSAFSNGGSATIIVNDQPIFMGIIDTGDFDFIQRVITVSGRDKSGSLHEMKTSEKWVNKTPQDIIQDLAGRAGLSPQVTASAMLKAGRQVTQDFSKLSDGVSFADIIHKMSELLGANWYVQGNNLIVSDQTGTGSYSLNYSSPSPFVRSDCLSLKVCVNFPAAAGNMVTVKSWHPKQRMVNMGTGMAGGGGGGGGKMQNFTFHLPALTMDHAQQWAKSRSKEIARHAFTLHAEVVGDPTIAAGMSIQLSGTGQFDKSYFADEVTHSFGMGGYTTSITGRTAGDSGGSE